MRIIRITVRFLGMQGEYGDAWKMYEVTIYTEAGKESATIEDDWGLKGFLRGLEVHARMFGFPKPPEPERIG